MQFMNPQQKLRLYLDTTIPSYVFALDSPERMQITRRFMALQLLPEYDMVISDIVMGELIRASEPLRGLLLEQVAGLEIFPMTVTAEQLAAAYIRHKILPPGSVDDARHVALATLNRADALVSWNFGHLVNIRRIMAINELHEQMGLRIIEIVTPEEVLG
jgi:hypothetical protein